MSQAPKYTPNPVPDNPEDLPQYLLQEFQKQYQYLRKLKDWHSRFWILQPKTMSQPVRIPWRWQLLQYIWHL